MHLPRYSQSDIEDKKVLLRLDLDVDDNNLRLQRSGVTIKELLDFGARQIIILGHRGRPQNGPEPDLSLAAVRDKLQEFLNKVGVQEKINLLDDINRAEGEINSRLLMLENLRFWSGEKAGDVNFAKILARWGEIYINDAFGNCHRADASMAALPSLMKFKFAGPNVINEVTALEKFVKELGTPFLLVLGGIKISTKLPLIKKFINRAQAILLGGGLANTFLKSRGEIVGQSVIEEEMLPEAKALTQDNIVLPQDLVIRTKNAQIAVLEATGVGDGDFILDIGPKTISRYVERIKNARSVLWNGPLGKFEDKSGAEGTIEIAQALAGSRGQTLAGGGETVLALEKNNLIDKIDFVSAGGGAMLTFLAGEPMPALQALL